MDKEWLKNAARFFKSDQESFSDNSSIIANNKARYICRDLYEASIQAIELFNLYSDKNHAIRNFTLKREDPLALEGFVLMLSKHRARVFLNKKDNQLICEYDEISGFTYNLVDRYIYTLYKDRFGATLWGLDEKFLMNQDTLLQYILAKLFEFAKNNQQDITQGKA